MGIETLITVINNHDTVQLHKVMNLNKTTDHENVLNTFVLRRNSFFNITNQDSISIFKKNL